MRCPACSSVLSQRQVENTTADCCFDCGGIWLNADKLWLLASRLASLEQGEGEFDIFFKPRDVLREKDIHEEVRSCPDCYTPLEKFNYAYDSNIILDRCKRCGGIWADRGELRQIAMHIKGNEQVRTIGQAIIKNEAIEEIEELEETAKDVALSLRGFRIVFPVGDDISCNKKPVITILLIVLCVLSFLRMVYLRAGSYEVYRDEGLSPSNFFSTGLLTHMFVHAGFFHLAGNLLYLWIFGDNVEDRLGRVKYVLFYLSAGLAACVLHSLIYRGSEIPLVGASGAISGVMGAYLVFYPKANITVFHIRRLVETSAVYFIGSWFVLQLLNGLIYLRSENCRVAWFAHVGGFVFGAFFAYFVKKQEAAEVSAT